MFASLAPACSRAVIERTESSWLPLQSFWTPSGAAAHSQPHSPVISSLSFLPAVCYPTHCSSHADALMVHNFMMCLCLNNSVPLTSSHPQNCHCGKQVFSKPGNRLRPGQSLPDQAAVTSRQGSLIDALSCH